jgi:hypothetical protein
MNTSLWLLPTLPISRTSTRALAVPWDQGRPRLRSPRVFGMFRVKGLLVEEGLDWLAEAVR